jgi:hypothetical protein
MSPWCQVPKGYYNPSENETFNQAERQFRFLLGGLLLDLVQLSCQFETFHLYLFMFL